MTADIENSIVSVEKRADISPEHATKLIAQARFKCTESPDNVYSEESESCENHTGQQQTHQILQEKCNILRSRIQHVSERRKQVEKAKESIFLSQKKLLTRHNMSERCRSLAIAKLRSVNNRCTTADNLLNLMRKINVTNDCFHIWHTGLCGTINGLRLGSHVSNALESADDQQLTNPSTIPWTEVNAGLGTAALLLSLLEEKPDSPIHFSTHKIIPMGSFSKIALLYNGGKSSTVYNLFSDDSFQIFGKRNFNIALNGLLHCLFDAAEATSKRDIAMRLPYPLEKLSAGELTIGKLSIAYGTDGERWTRALKYFLINLKWLVAFITKHVER